MRRNKKLEADLEGTIQKHVGKRKGLPFEEPIIPLFTKLVVIAVCLLAIAGFGLLYNAHNQGYNQCVKDLSPQPMFNGTVLEGQTIVSGVYYLEKFSVEGFKKFTKVDLVINPYGTMQDLGERKVGINE